tara:strand:- start:338 stop:475 length:138 start_codon:yes stop_codon:yes gene_type:complete
MNINLEKLSLEFKSNLKIDYDLKKKIGLILAAKPKFIIKLIVLKN